MGRLSGDLYEHGGSDDDDDQFRRDVQAAEAHAQLMRSLAGRGSRSCGPVAG